MGAVYAVLNVSTFTAVATGGLHHGQAPQKTSLPYAVLQAPAGYLALPAMQSAAEKVRFQLKALSLVDYAVALQLIDLAKQLLDGERPAITNHLVIKLAWEWTQVYPEPELVNGVPVFSAVSQWSALVDQVS